MMDRLARCWTWLGRTFKERPVQLIMLMIAALVVAVTLTTSLVQGSENSGDIKTIRQALCNDPVSHPGQAQDCQHLFDRLLEHPTTEQVIRLRQIIKNGE